MASGVFISKKEVRPKEELKIMIIEKKINIK